MNKNKVKEYIIRYKENDKCLRHCLLEGLIYHNLLHIGSLCNNCKFNTGDDYNFECDKTISTLI